jgi:hypothetical protein
MLVSNSNCVDMLKCNYSHMAFVQMPTEQEAKEGFTKAFEHMFTVLFKAKLS